jgi:prepilin-type N-terminal cleavage/methylation domain-containing protein/prepilin-type processing-associated H-X9-DG protein
MIVHRERKTAFTLVELLVVIAILGVLMGLLIPAVNSVRESMRRTQCKNNLAQIGTAVQAHLTAQNHFPSSGWGSMWMGDPDRGFGMTQPGGWIYNLLPYMGFSTIHDIGKGLQGGGSGTPQYTALTDAKKAVIPILNCPTRRRGVAYPTNVSGTTGTSYNAGMPAVLNKTDYAANGGSYIFLGQGPKIDCLTVGLAKCTSWNISTKAGSVATQVACKDLEAFNGVSGILSEVRQIPDGQSYVFFSGEKYLNPNMYSTGKSLSDNNSALQGNDRAMNRFVADDSNKVTSLPPMRDATEEPSSRFGSAHAQGVHFVFCDGHVQMLNYQVDTATYRSLGVRNDGTGAGDY